MLVAMDKIVRVGKTSEGNLFAKIVYRDGRLSITGVIGPMQNGDCKGGAGQIVMSPWNIDEFARGWDTETADKFRAVWHKWHLNDMQAGSPAQTEFLDSLRESGASVGDYTNQIKLLEDAGMNPDANYLHNGEPYRYGTAWLKVDVPQDILAWLSDLPESDTIPAWV